MIDDRITTTRTVVTFLLPFQLSNFESPEPAGAFEVDIDNERIEGVSSVAHRHLATYIYLSGASGTRMVLVNPGELNAALERDRVAHQAIAQATD